MLRVGEVLLSVAPLLFALLLYGVVMRRLPSRRAVILLCAAEGLVAGALIWQGTTEGLRPHEHYVPAHMRDGSVVEGHGG